MVNASVASSNNSDRAFPECLTPVALIVSDAGRTFLTAGLKLSRDNVTSRYFVVF